MSRARVGARHLAMAAVIVLLALAVALRVRLMLGKETGVDSDEAVVGLMATRLLKHGELRAFYWQHNYGGALESVLVAPFIWLFGTTRLGLRSATVLLELLTSWLCWRVARHLLPRVQAALAGLLSLFFPLANVWFGVKETAFYPLSAALGMASLLMAINVDEHPRVRRHWIGLGCTTGVGLWMSPNVLYYAAPIVLWLVVRRRYREVQNVTIAAAAFLLGSAPWLRANISTDWESLSQPHLGGNSTYFGRFHFFWSEGLPFALGLRAPYSGAWYLRASVAIALYVLALIAIAYVIARTRWWTTAPDVYMFITAPFIWAAFNANWRILQGRYTFFIASILPILLGRVMVRRVGLIFVAVLTAFATLGFARTFLNWKDNRPWVAPIVAELEQRGVRTVIANYWTAYLITFESDEKIIATPLPPMAAARYQPYVDAVRASSPAYVFPIIAHDQITRVATMLDARRIGFQTVKKNGYLAIIPDRAFVHSF